MDLGIAGKTAVVSASSAGLGYATAAALAEAEAALKSGASHEEVAELADSGLTPPTDIHGNEAYRRHLSQILLKRALDN